MSDPHQIVQIDYTNYRGQRSVRKIIPDGTMIFDSNEWHPIPQWLFGALDVEKGQYRLFALCGVHMWTNASTEHGTDVVEEKAK